MAGTAPPDFPDPAPFFSRTCFTRARTEHSGTARRRLSGRTGEHRAGPDADHALRRRHDAHARVPLSPRQRRCVADALPGVVGGVAWDPVPGREMIRAAVGPP